MTPPTSPLTKSQQRVLTFLQTFVAEQGFPPTHAEISEALGFRSANAAKEHLRLMAKKGVIELVPGVSRGLRLVPKGKADPRGRAEAALRAAQGASELPLIGRVAAGQPILAEAHVDRMVALDPSLFRPRPDYLLRVRGDSMIEAGILDDDLVLVHATPRARDGDIAVVRLDDEVTVKRWREPRSGRYATRLLLEPANAALRPIVVDPRRTTVFVEGLVVGLLRAGMPRRSGP